MLATTLTCPRCQSTHAVKNGTIHNGRQNFKCKAGGRQFVQHPTKKMIGQKTRNLIDKLLLERLSLAGITRVTELPSNGYKLMSTLNMKRLHNKLRLKRKKGAANNSRR